VTRAATTASIGVADTSMPVSALGSRCSASDSRNHGTTISTAANSTNARHGPRSAASRPRRKARGSSTAAPSAVRTKTSTPGLTSATAARMNRYGIPR
jgi:hypothetical protein